MKRLFSRICLSFVLRRRITTMSFDSTVPTGLSSTITLNDGVVMPSFGFGTYRLSDNGCDAETITSFALQNGYRLLDTAAFYRFAYCFRAKLHLIVSFKSFRFVLFIGL